MVQKPDAAVTLHPLQPFNFNSSCTIFTRSDSYTHTAYINGTLYKCVERSGEPALITIRGERSALRARLYGQGAVEWLESSGNWLISSELNLKPFYAKADDVMAPIIERLYGLKPPRTASVYEALVIAYTEQQISLRVAMAFQERIVKRYGKMLQHGGLIFYSFPAPEVLASADVDELRTIGLSRNKADFITGASKKVASGEIDLESLKAKPTPEAREALRGIRGVGEWTSDYVLVRGLGRVEMVPYDDIGTQDSVGLFYKGGVRAMRKEVEEILGHFGEYAGLANYYLIYARFFGVEPRPT
jgi:DNA-3-methyladenine glycosylase II